MKMVDEYKKKGGNLLQQVKELLKEAAQKEKLKPAANAWKKKKALQAGAALSKEEQKILDQAEEILDAEENRKGKAKNTGTVGATSTTSTALTQVAACGLTMAATLGLAVSWQ